MWEFPQYKNYRKSQNVLAASWFKQNNFLTQDKYPFILKNKTQWRNNIILSEVADFIEVKKIESEKSKTPFPLHKYIHHGLSSQAMLFNLL